MRVIFDNAADRATLQSATATVANMGVSNLQNDVKTKLCRTTTAANGVFNLTATWAATETIGGIVLAFTDCPANATMRVRVYTLATDSTPVYDSTSVAVKANFGNHDSVQTQNGIASTGGFYACHWLPTKRAARKVEITLTSPLGGSVQAGRLIIGDYWEPTIGAEQQGTSMTFVDLSDHFRTESGDMHVNVKPQYRKQTISLPSLDITDRTKMWNILWRNGKVKPLYISLFPNNSDGEIEQVHQIYGRLVANPAMTTPYWKHMSATIEIEEV